MHSARIAHLSFLIRFLSSFLVCSRSTRHLTLYTRTVQYDVQMCAYIGVFYPHYDHREQSVSPSPPLVAWVRRYYTNPPLNAGFSINIFQNSCRRFDEKLCCVCEPCVVVRVRFVYPREEEKSAHQSSAACALRSPETRILYTYVHTHVRDPAPLLDHTQIIRPIRRTPPNVHSIQFQLH